MIINKGKLYIALFNIFIILPIGIFLGIKFDCQKGNQYKCVMIENIKNIFNK